MTDTTNDIDWEIIGVFDPDTGVDFAYTVGLFDRGLPELHLWCQPTGGVDPGAGWRLSQRDMQITLNDVARELILGTRAVGDRWSTTLDSGLTTVHWHLAEPVDQDEVHAYGADPAADVLPLRWELRRSTIEPPDEATQTRAFDEVVRRLALLPGHRTVPTTPVDLGPAAVAIAQARRVARGCDASVFLRGVAGSHSEERGMSGTLTTLLEAAGRGEWAPALHEAAHADARVVAAAIDDPDERFRASVESTFAEVLRACYLAVAAADLLDRIEAPPDLAWRDLAPNVLRGIADVTRAELSLGTKLRRCYELVQHADALGTLGEEADRAAMALAWWGITRHGQRLDVHRWMDAAEAAGCDDDDEVLGVAVEVVNAWAVASLPGAPTHWTSLVVPFVDVLR